MVLALWVALRIVGFGYLLPGRRGPVLPVALLLVTTLFAWTPLPRSPVSAPGSRFARGQRGLEQVRWTAHGVPRLHRTRGQGAWRPAIEIAADQVLSPLVEGATVDVVEEFAAVVPVTVISHLLGVPISDRDHFKKLSNSLTETFDPVVVGARRDAAIRDSVELLDYIRDLAGDRARASPARTCSRPCSTPRPTAHGSPRTR